MATYDWPAEWCPNRFELTLVPNTRVFIGPYTPSVQVLDLMGERWSASLDLPPSTDAVKGAAKEAFFNRLRGPVNRIRMGNLRNPLPLGTMRGGQAINVVNGSLVPVNVVNASLQPVQVVSGSPTTSAAMAAGTNVLPLQGYPGKTVLAGTTLGVNGQMVQIVQDATLDANGRANVEFIPRLRAAAPLNAPIVWDRPTATFMVQSDKVPVTWRPGMHDVVSLDLIETY